MREFTVIIRDEKCNGGDIVHALGEFEEVEIIDKKRVYHSRVGDVVKANATSIVFMRTSNDYWISSINGLTFGVESIEDDVVQGYATLVMRDGKPV